MLDSVSAESAWGFVQSETAVLVDLRSPEEFARGHPKNALSLPYSQKGLSDRLSFVVSQGVGVIVLAPNDDTAEAAFVQLGQGQFDLVGRLDGGLRAWKEAGLPVESLEEVSAEELAPASRSSETVVLDVREPLEWEMGHLPGALLISLGDLRRCMGAISRHARIVIICEAGIRSSTAASILQAEGFPAVSNVPGGTGAYRSKGLPLQYPEGTTS